MEALAAPFSAAYQPIATLSSEKQVDILMSKNQMLQILYLEHHAYKTS